MMRPMKGGAAPAPSAGTPPPILILLALCAVTVWPNWVGLGADHSPPVPGGRNAFGSDWESFLGPTRNAKSAEVGILEDWPESGPPIAWFRTVGEGYSSPAVSRGRLFHFDRVGDKARLTCLKARTGRELWQVEYASDYSDYYEYSNGPRTSPVVDGDRVFTFGVEGRLRSHSVSNGELLWDVDTGREFGVVQNFFGVGSTPVVHGELLIVMVGGSPPGSPPVHSGEVRGNGSAIVAFDKATGKPRYRLSDELASYSTPVVTRIGDRLWGFALTRGGLLAFEPIAGKEDFLFPWRAKMLESVNASTPVVVGERVFISETYGLGSALLEISSGSYKVVWKDPPGRGQSLATHWNTAVHHEGFLYASSGRHSSSAELRCIRLTTGEVMWTQPGLKRATILYVDGHLVVLSESGQLRLLRVTPDEYHEVALADLAQVKVEGEQGSLRPLIVAPAWNAPVLSHGLLYLRGKDTLVALDLLPAPAGTVVTTRQPLE